MKQKHFTNTILALALTGIVGGSVYVRSSILKMGLGLLGVCAIAGASSVNSKIDECVVREYEEKLKRYKATIGELEIEIDQLQKQGIELEANHQTELENLRENHRLEIANLASENYQAFEQKISLINRKHALEIERLKAENDGEIKASDEIIDKLRTEKKQLQGTISTLQKEFESIRDDYAQRCQSLESERSHFNATKQQFELEQKEFEVRQREIQNAANQNIFLSSKKESEAISKEWEKLNQAKLQFNKSVIETRNSFESVKSENEILKQKLGLSQKVIASNNGRYNTASIEGFLADRIESFFRRNQLPINYVQSIATTPDRLKLQFSAKEESKEDIMKLQKALSCDVFGGNDVSVKREGGYIVIDVPKVNGSVETDKVDFIPGQTDPDYLKDFLLTANHLIVMGASDDGKSTLISNLLTLAGLTFEREGKGKPEVKLLNPKPTAVVYSFFGKPLIADYMNCKKSPNTVTPTCDQGLEDMMGILQDRMDRLQVALENNQPAPKFPPLIVVLDECLMMRNRFKELFDSFVLELPFLGRESNMMVVLVGQKIECNDWGFNRSNFQNFHRIYMVSLLNLETLAKNEINNLTNSKDVYESISECQKNASQTEKYHPNNFYGLFIPQKRNRGTITYLPAPDYFINNSISDTLECPSCQSNEVVKNGIKHGKQNYLCRSCDTQFTDNNGSHHVNTGGLDGALSVSR